MGSRLQEVPLFPTAELGGETPLARQVGGVCGFNAALCQRPSGTAVVGISLDGELLSWFQLGYS